MNAKISWLLFMLLFTIVMPACQKAEQEQRTAENSASQRVFEAGKETVTHYPMPVGETGVILPPGSTIIVSADESEVRVTLPKGYAFVSDAPASKVLPVLYSTYTCICSKQGNPCKVFYADGLGFGCLQYTCAGSCTGKFTYMGYTVDKVISTTDKGSFFSDPAILRQLIKRVGELAIPVTGKISDPVYLRQDLYGVQYYLVTDAKTLPSAFLYTDLLPTRAVCECEGTKACKLRTITMESSGRAIEIHFCDGNCNGCELTVD